MSPPSPKTILVTGDFIIDHHIYEGSRHHYGDSAVGVNVTVQSGGAGLVAGLLKELPGLKENVFWEREMPAEGRDQDISHHAYAFWRQLPADNAPEKRFWRCDQAMGFGDRNGDGKENVEPPCKCWRRPANLPQRPDIIVISEGGMGFRDTKTCWESLAFDTASLIILKTAWPLAQGDLWSELSVKHCSKLMLVVAADELRKSNARLSAGLSWEATFHDLVRELAADGRLRSLAQCRHLIVTFGSEGAAWFDFASNGMGKKSSTTEDRACFVYQAGSIEHDHALGTEGTAFGFLTCMTAALARASALSSAAAKVYSPDDGVDFGSAVEAGLAAMRELREKGHGPATEKPYGFPFKGLAEVICSPTVCYTRASLTWKEATEFFSTPKASILSLTRRSMIRGKHEPAWEFAGLIAIHGPVALENLPHLRVGKFLTADRNEVESLRTLAQVIRRYDKRDEGKKPLSIGVFGPPGAGKSFAVREMASTFLGKKAAWLEFNLSQFASPDDLNGAFHQVRDSVLQGKLPIAFFDEFDSRGFFWLQYLLAPMQDGRFQQGELTHTLGKAIFIFAGGTSWTFDSFGPPEPKPGATGDPEAVRRFGEFRLSKGPDFKSRLDAFLDVVGPNRRAKPAPANATSDYFEVSGHRLVEDTDDIWFPIRRALILRVDLGLAPNHYLGVDPGLLRAILRVPCYTHGTRSLTKILAPLKSALPAPLQPSFLPPRSQLAMHADVREFQSLCAEAEQTLTIAPEALSAEDEQRVAPAIHETWRELSRRTRTLKKEDDLPFEAFPDEELAKARTAEIEASLADKNLSDEQRKKLLEEKLTVAKKAFRRESNSAAARRIPDILILVGLRLSRHGARSGKWQPGEAKPDHERRIRQHIEYHLELLANAEHQSWMDWHFEQGWSYHPKLDDGLRRHNCLQPFTKLGEADRNKDREQVRQYPNFAKRAGYKIEFVRATTAKSTAPKKG